MDFRKNSNYKINFKEGELSVSLLFLVKKDFVLIKTKSSMFIFKNLSNNSNT